MFQQTGAVIFCMILALTYFESTLGCLDYGSQLCTIVHSTRHGTIGHGRSCSGIMLTYMYTASF